MGLIMIACLDINNGLGDAEGNLLFDLPKDMAHFKSTTTGKHVVMGRKTWDSLPIKPLPKRKNYVLTKDESFEIEGKTKVLHSIDEVIQMSKSKDVYIIGGGEIYNQFIGYANRLIITHVHNVNLEARVFFPEIDLREWELAKVVPNKKDDKHLHSFTFTTYKRKATREEILAKIQESIQTKNPTQE